MKTILEEKLITTYKEETIAFLKSHPEYFEEAIELAVTDKQPFSWRAAFLLGSCMEYNDKRVQKHLNKIVQSINSKKDGHQRELLKILLQMDLTPKHEGVLFNICMNLWEQIGKSPSVRFTALKFILKIAKKHPDLSKEITFLTQDHYLETLSPGAKESVLRMLKAFAN